MPLTAKAVQAAKPKEKDYKLSDSGGLYLLVKKNGAKYWRQKYRFLGKEKLFAIGVYPHISLKQAREQQADIKKQLAQGTDPGEQKKAAKQEAISNSQYSFENVARQWWDSNRETWSAKHADRIIKSLERDVFPDLGNKPIKHITTGQILTTLRKVEARDALDVASRLLQRCTLIFRFAVQTGIAEHNPASELKGALKTRKVKHQASLPPNELPEFLNKLDTYDGNLVTQLALKLLVLTFVRPGELRGAQWKEFDLKKKLWRIPGGRMKMKTEHLVPLSGEAIAVIEQLRPITGSNELVFPGERSKRKPISENTLTYALYRLGYKGRATAHGFRATASSILNEQGFNRDAIERQLAHMERNDVRAAYTHHAEYLEERTEIMRWWGKYLYKGGK